MPLTMPQSTLTAPVQSQSEPINSHESAFIQQSTTSTAISPVPSTTSSTPTTVATMSSIPTSGLLSLDHYRFQLYNYAMAERLRCAQYSQPMPQICSNYPAAAAAALMGPYGPRLALSMSLFHNRVFQPEEPKPQHSYIGLIAIAILNSPECKLVLSDIYQYILDNYPYFRTRGPGWRNSIRHNLSLNDCFVKAGRSANGKGHYWSIHPANLEDFKKGDFRRRKAQRKVRKHMGLSVDDDGTDSPSPPPLSITPPPISTALQWMNAIGNHHGMFQPGIAEQSRIGPIHHHHHHPHHTQHHITATTKVYSTVSHRSSARKRQFDVASLLAPDNHDIDEKPIRTKIQIQQTTHCDIEEEIDVEESEESDNNNRSIFDAEHFHRQHKLRLFVDDENIKSDINRRSSEETATTDLAEYQDNQDHDQMTMMKKEKCSQYSVCEIEDDSVHLPYNSMNDDNNLGMAPKIRQHLELANAAVNAPSIDPRILVSRYYGHRIAAVNSQQYNNAH